MEAHYSDIMYCHSICRIYIWHLASGKKKIYIPILHERQGYTLASSWALRPLLDRAGSQHIREVL